MEELFCSEPTGAPSQRDYLSVLKARSEELFSEHSNLYDRLTAGEMGEQEVLRYFHDYGKKHWRYVRNYWSDVNGTIEADLIIFTSVGCYTLEVKNYIGKFEYADGSTTIDGYEYSSDCIFQARRSYKNIRRVLARYVQPQNIQGALVFIGEHNEVIIHSHVNDIQIVRRHQLRKFIRQIAEDERASQFDSFNFEHISKQLEHYRTDDPFTMASLSNEEMRFVQTGIACAHCSRLDTHITRKFVRCNCGYKELRETATLRTIEEYRVLRYDQKMRVGALYQYMGGVNTRQYLHRVLSTHYAIVKCGKNTYYIQK